MSGGFKKNVRIKAPDIVGTKISVENAQLLVSTGAPDFDSVIGGGLAVGTLLLLEEDKSNSYANLLAKLFLAEGIAVGHPLFVASKNTDVDKLVESIPPEIETSNATTKSSETNKEADEDLKIAWRYKHLPSGNSGNSNNPNQFGHHFDLSRSLAPEIIASTSVSKWTEKSKNHDTSKDLPSEIDSLFDNIKQALAKHNCYVNNMSADPSKQRTVLRLAILSFGSPFWTTNQSLLPSFIYSLRALLRSTCAVALVSMPLHMLESTIASRCRRMSDYCIHPQPAMHVDGKVNPLLSGHNGVFKILKLPVINSIAPYKPETFDLGFKVRRKKFSIEKLQLPPEIAESAEREQDDAVGSKVRADLGCGSASNKNLDF